MICFFKVTPRTESNSLKASTAWLHEPTRIKSRRMDECPLNRARSKEHARNSQPPALAWPDTERQFKAGIISNAHRQSDNRAKEALDNRFSFRLAQSVYMGRKDNPRPPWIYVADARDKPFLTRNKMRHRAGACPAQTQLMIRIRGNSKAAKSHPTDCRLCLIGLG